eukprot:TRINITY_DN12389_c0_g2_i2.p2 TRINITY_DN12389_c0_g2~~TRINITY_DN12389_c0_g2_i2.p2  ORF type:complete len:290 (-),score=125.37 TRINITY_DN12389_c0_g2_i2:16-885(-)
MDVTSTENSDIKEETLRTKNLKLLSKNKSTHLLIYLEVNPAPIENDDDKVKEELKEEAKPENEGEMLKLDASVKEVEGKPAKFVEYAPRIFHQIRKMDGITSEILQWSFDPKKNKQAIFKAGESQGKSGSFFFFTHNRQFLIKTMNKAELKILLDLLPKYYVHCIKNRKSIIARILGLYKLKLPDMDAMYFFLMENVVQLSKDSKLLGIFDLKGSVVNRNVDEKGKTVKDTLKDCNYTRRIKHNKELMNFDREDAKNLLSIIEKDVLSLIHICRCRRYAVCRSRWSPYH